MIAEESKILNLEKHNKKLPDVNFFSQRQVSQPQEFSTDRFIEHKKKSLIKEQIEDIRPSDILRKISQIYTIEDTFVVGRFLHKHSTLIDVLLEAHPQIRKYFPLEKLRLKLYVDPESPQWEKLVLSICATPESVDEALNKLDEFDQEWWIDASLGVAVNLCINLDFE
ncbi:hypothetical protein [Cylindrospermum sp. FACHB-282]|uniref:hypothetical protein n=1 Tax=Cylindrospermum sp. FACHB-282 TaxID=2692794 RepID=UPI0016855C80|nr:hypothetical protein [Cylindrospermum sp. FACHB-282]MBD2388103.1 hypothetical protein [Cylindrospermum sp. FACHB-282]